MAQLVEVLKTKHGVVPFQILFPIKTVRLEGKKKEQFSDISRAKKSFT